MTSHEMSEDKGHFGWEELPDYNSTDGLIFEQEETGCKIAIGVVASLLRLPFYAAFGFSFYCVCVVIATFVAQFLTAYALAPITAALDNDGPRRLAAHIALFTSVPLVAFLGFVLVKVFKAVWEAIIESLVSALQDSGSLGKECMDPERERIDRFCPSVITILQCMIGCLFVWITFWVKYGVLVMGLIPFTMVA
jgi:predicted PurR-regulated permease PerM